MKIHFCDLCNESVPQADLDAGRAFMRKGRVVCGRCDQLMTTRDEPSAPLPAGGGPFGGAPASAGSGAGAVVGTVGAAGPGAGAPSGGATATAEATLTHVGAAPHDHPAAHPGHHHHHTPRSSSSGGGLAVGLVAIGLTACASYWLLERSEKQSTEVSARLAKMERDLEDADRRAMDRSTAGAASLAEFQEKQSGEVENLRKAIEARLSQADTKQAEGSSAVADLRHSIRELESLRSGVQRHDQELSASALRFAELEARSNELATAIANLKEDVEAVLKGAPGGGGTGDANPPKAPGAPAWMGLVQQLESANSGDRWVAVQSLGETRDPAVAEYLLPRLKDVDIFVRMVTARVLGELGNAKATGALIDTLSDNDGAVREAAYLALCTITKKTLPFEPYADAAERAKKVKGWQDWWKKAQEEAGAK